MDGDGWIGRVESRGNRFSNGLDETLLDMPGSRWEGKFRIHKDDNDGLRLTNPTSSLLPLQYPLHAARIHPFIH